jgi:hydrogenase nickel incorporation protein HypA/HybF
MSQGPMHEYSVLQSLVERVEAEQRVRDATAVHAIHLRIGELAGVEVGLLEHAWTLFRELPEWAHTELRIETVPALWTCPSCDAAIERGAVLRCPRCAVPARLERGDEIVLQRIEMEVTRV